MRIVHILGFKDLYSVSEYGHVFSIRRKKWLKPDLVAGYHQFTLSHNGESHRFKAHRLVAANFIPNPDYKPFINHKDGNKINNHVSNLEWCTAKENNVHAYKTGLKILPMGAEDKRSWKILQFKKDGTFLREWNSMKECQRNGGFNQGSISNCIKGIQKTSHGFIWKKK